MSSTDPNVRRLKIPRLVVTFLLTSPVVGEINSYSFLVSSGDFPVSSAHKVSPIPPHFQLDKFQALSPSYSHNVPPPLDSSAHIMIAFDVSPFLTAPSALSAAAADWL